MKEFKVQVDHESPFANGLYVMAEPHQAREAALALSVAYAGQRVTVSAFARNRLVALDGEVIDEVKELEEFYLEPNDQDSYDWRRV